MKKQYFIILSIIVIALLGANIFFLVNKRSCNCNHIEESVDKREKNVNSNCFIAKSLSLDDEQAKKYDKIKKNGRIKQDKLIKSALKLGDDEMFIPFSTITKKGREDVLKIIESYL